jgi:rare lipoprotein A
LPVDHALPLILIVARVRLGPFDTPGEAEAALAKARVAGYSDARIQRAD